MYYTLPVTHWVVYPTGNWKGQVRFLPRVGFFYIDTISLCVSEFINYYKYYKF